MLKIHNQIQRLGPCSMTLISLPRKRRHWDLHLRAESHLNSRGLEGGGLARRPGAN